MDVKKVEYKMIHPFAKVGDPKADNDSSNQSEKTHKTVFLAKIFNLNMPYSYCIFFNFLAYINSHKTAKHLKKTLKGHYGPLRRSRRFKFSTVLVLKILEKVQATLNFSKSYRTLPKANGKVIYYQ